MNIEHEYLKSMGFEKNVFDKTTIFIYKGNLKGILDINYSKNKYYTRIGGEGMTLSEVLDQLGSYRTVINMDGFKLFKRKQRMKTILNDRSQNRLY